MTAGSSGPASAAGDAFEDLFAVLAAEHDRVDAGHRQRIAVGERRRRRAELAGERSESSAAFEVRDDAMIRRQVAVERIGERSTLYRADAEHAGARASCWRR